MIQKALAAATAAVLGAAVVQAQITVGSSEEGRDFARQVCAYCHYVEPDGPRVDPLAPRSFVSIATDPKTTETGLRVFMQTSHIEMPDFILTSEQTDDVVAYILSLKTAPPAE